MRPSRVFAGCLVLVGMCMLILLSHQAHSAKVESRPDTQRSSPQVMAAASEGKSHRCVKVPGMGDRCAPWFFIIGVFKGATTSMYNYLGRHPEVRLNIAGSDGEDEDLSEEEEDEEDPRSGGQWDRLKNLPDDINKALGLDKRRRPAAEGADPMQRPVRTKETNFFTSFNRTGKVLPLTMQGAKQPTAEDLKRRKRSRPQTVAEYMDAYFPKLTSKDNLVTGEATPSYIYAPLVPDRLHSTFPHARAMLLLRDPVTRSFSRVAHAAQLRCDRSGSGPSRPSFCDTDELADIYDLVIEKELVSVQRCLDQHDIHPTIIKDINANKWHVLVDCFNSASSSAVKMLQDGTLALAGPSKLIAKHMIHLKTVSHGLYLLQLLYWHRIFPKDQILLLRSEDVFTQPAEVMKTVESYLSLEPYDWTEVVKHKYNVGIVKGKKDADFVKEAGGPKITSKKIHAETLLKMHKFFHPWNELLASYMGLPYSPWPYPGFTTSTVAPAFEVKNFKFNLHAANNKTVYSLPDITSADGA